jgi:hypothetical protein
MRFKAIVEGDSIRLGRGFSAKLRGRTKILEFALDLLRQVNSGGKVMIVTNPMAVEHFQIKKAIHPIRARVLAAKLLAKIDRVSA